MLTMNSGMPVYADDTTNADTTVNDELGQGLENGSAETAEVSEDATAESAEDNDSDETAETATAESQETPEIVGTSETQNSGESQDGNGVALYGTEVSINDTLLVDGGVQGTDYSYDNSSMTLTVMTDTPLTLRNKYSNSESNINIIIANGVNATLKLNNLTINRSNGPAISMGESTANVTIILADGSHNHLYGNNAAGIEKLSQDGTLTITCEHSGEVGHVCDNNCGFLEVACSSGYGAGVGASGNSGNISTGGIYISGGLIQAKGTDGAGIGGSNTVYVSDINISGGYLHDDTAHWYACTGSTACKANGYGEHDGAATCAEKAKCTVCGAEYGSTLNHEMELIEAVEPTCIDDGNREYYHCKTCGKYFSAVEGNKEYYVCDTCGKLYTDEHGNDETTLADVTLAATGKHIFGDWTEITPADCTTAGVKSHHCVRCDAVTDETEIPATGHTFGNWTVITPADCTHDGVKAHTCTLCNKTETEPIEKLGHNFSTEWTIDIPAGCTTKGIKTHHCIVCDEKADETIIPAAGHKFGRWKVVVEPTTEQKGLQRRTCTVCDTVE